MSSSGKQKKGSSGVRILWIPGRKKHNYKGRYEPTNKGQSHGQHTKKIEPWSLGGSKGQRDLINPDMPGTSDVPSVAMLPTTYALTSSGDAPDKLETVKEEDDREHGFPEGGSNTRTLRLKDRKNGSCVSNDDLDTIENLSEAEGTKKSLNDLTDGILYPAVPSKRKSKKKKKCKENEECKEPNEKCVTCLYYTLMCCECTIS
ncbi:uncharacterized protein LOC132262359 [Phlebotomus argentipes]|uniref:uncharacterized protein LOC132262359 n=1 Tax=Phlebotomus argentipes TaxID=94469 RepID=UPI002892D1B5|nr:uncharacterized protein LOC132262359 [Phlebotomus argentipes]